MTKKVKEKQRKNIEDKIFVLQKQVGQTPLEVLNLYKEKNNLDKKTKLAYAGRLDPMAEGKLLVLQGQKCKERSKYLNLDKEYVFEILLNFKSDTSDVLGLAEYKENQESLSFEQINQKIKKFKGKRKMEYPVFSSKTVDGKPLFLHALEKNLKNIKIPTKDVKIYNIFLEEINFLGKEKLKKEIFRKINSIKKVEEESKKLGNDFRRDEIRKQWNELFNSISQDNFTILKIRCVASSGTYMRVLAKEIAQKLGFFGLAYSINRTKIGKKTFFGFKEIK
ncbi:hypothetical protein CSB11_02390 [Candidatus Campbellbacteria bacterium]|nr:MAG: hypothetical protein CSB11_02390 [Candidatus Campbellbacteria bacterium]